MGVFILNYIQSKDNALIVNTRKLNEKKYRTQQNIFIVEGFRFVEEALKSDFKVKYVFLSESQQYRWNSFGIQKKLQKDTEAYIVNDSVFKTLCSTETPQGIIAVVENKKSALDRKEGFYIIADGIQDPGNLGTIIRTADAAAALGVILLKGTVDVYNSKTLRSTMGSIFHLPVINCDDLKLVEELKKSGYRLIVSTLEGSSNFYAEKLKGKILIAVGNEGSGVSKEILSLADSRVRIPMPGGAESLNAAVAASVMMFEAVRQNLFDN